jgi:hypothetical protein
MPPDLNGKDDNALTVMYQNCIRAIIENNKFAPQARAQLEQINDIWSHRLKLAASGLYKADTPTVGVLKTVGYQVGNSGEKSARRREILDFVMSSRLPPVGSPAYMLEWGEPNSKERYRKLHRVLTVFRSGGLHDPKMDQACRDWGDDLAYIEAKWRPRGT